MLQERGSSPDCAVMQPATMHYELFGLVFPLSLYYPSSQASSFPLPRTAVPLYISLPVIYPSAEMDHARVCAYVCVCVRTE